jgi:hypothetical protein
MNISCICTCMCVGCWNELDALGTLPSRRGEWRSRGVVHRFGPHYSWSGGCDGLCRVVCGSAVRVSRRCREMG